MNIINAVSFGGRTILLVVVELDKIPKIVISGPHIISGSGHTNLVVGVYCHCVLCM